MTESHSGLTPRPAWAPDDVDVTRPSIARVYDYYLDGSHNFPADREVARQTLEAYPGVRMGAYANRAFLRRAVRFFVEQGVTQFLDIGSGIPTVGNVHEVAHAIDPRCRIVYVDIDPVAVTHSLALLADNPNTAVLHADLRDPDRVLTDPDANRVLDFGRPLALMMFAVLQFVPDTDDPAGVIRRYRDALSPGSYLGISHPTLDECPGQEQFAVMKVDYDHRVAQTTMRPREQVEGFFDGFELVVPGVVWAPDWRPEPDEEPVSTPNYGGVGRKR